MNTLHYYAVNVYDLYSVIETIKEWALLWYSSNSSSVRYLSTMFYDKRILISLAVYTFNLQSYKASDTLHVYS